MRVASPIAEGTIALGTFVAGRAYMPTQEKKDLGS